MGEHLYLTHPQVVIDPAVPVPRWGLSDVGRSRTHAFAAMPAVARYTRIISSNETKAIETAGIIAAVLGIAVEVLPEFHENDRSATGFLPPPEFEQVANQFFATPHKSVRGWERAIDAQARIVGAVTAALHHDDRKQPTLFVGHGGVGTLLWCHCAGVPIVRLRDQPPGGGNWYAFSLAPLSVGGPYRPMEEAP